jgi:hypothetical protein
VTFNNIDTTPITGSIVYSPSTTTSGNVVAILTLNKTGIIIGNDRDIRKISTDCVGTGLDLSSTEGICRRSIFTGNTTEVVQFHDTAGNTGSKTASVNRIDRAAPTLEISYTPDLTTLTNSGVTLTISGTDQASANGIAAGLAAQAYSFDGGTTRTGSTTNVYRANTSGTLAIRDAVGNIKTGAFEITNIDISAITGSIAYSPSTVTSGNVIAILTLNKTGMIIENDHDIRKISTDCVGTGLDLSTAIAAVCRWKEFTGNATEVVQFHDAAGNTGSETASVNRIDRAAPTLEISYTPDLTTLTNSGVTLTLSGTDQASAGGTAAGLAAQAYSFDGGTTRTGSTTNVYMANTSGTLAIRDSVGNIRTEPFEITNIDTTLPTATITYTPTTGTRTSGNVIVTLTLNEASMVLGT